MEHVCRISRIINNPRGNALLVGVGGSSKQSLTRLAAFISGQRCVSIELRKGYGIVDFRDELPRLPTGKLYKRTLKDEYLQASS